VVDIKNSNIRLAALSALTAKFFNKFLFSFPVPSALMKRITKTIPKILLAFRIAKSGLRFLSAPFAKARRIPSRRHVAFLAAILTRLFLGLIGIAIKAISAMRANHRDAGFRFYDSSSFAFIPCRAFTCAKFRTVRLFATTTFKLHATVIAFGFHKYIVSRFIKYFDIAVRRIESAMDETSLLDYGAKQEQEELAL